MQIDWWTLALQAINFLVLVWLLSRFLYRPVREVIEKRKRLADQAFSEAEEEKKKAEQARQRFEEARDALARERQELLKRTHEDLEKERRRALDRARQEADELLRDARRTIEKERQGALADVRRQVSEMAVALAAEILRESQAEAGPDGVLERLQAQLEGLPDQEKEQLLADLAQEDGYLEIVTPKPLEPQQRAAWAGRLEASLGVAGKVRFSADPEILGGAELRFPHAVLKWTWSDQLDKAKRLLLGDEAAS